MWPIGNVCYDLQKRAHCGRSFLLVVGHRTIGRTRGRASNTDWMTRSTISKVIVRLVVAINERSYYQSWPPTIDRGVLHEQSIGGASGGKVARPVARLIVRPLTIWNIRFQVLNMTIDLVATDLPLRSPTIFATSRTTSAASRTFFLRFSLDCNIVRSQVGRNLVVSLV